MCKRRGGIEDGDQPQCCIWPVKYWSNAVRQPLLGPWPCAEGGRPLHSRAKVHVLSGKTRGPPAGETRKGRGQYGTMAPYSRIGQWSLILAMGRNEESGSERKRRDGPAEGRGQKRHQGQAGGRGQKRRHPEATQCELNGVKFAPLRGCNRIEGRQVRTSSRV
jgi:hypothetical protein